MGMGVHLHVNTAKEPFNDISAETLYELLVNFSRRGPWRHVGEQALRWIWQSTHICSLFLVFTFILSLVLPGTACWANFRSQSTSGTQCFYWRFTCRIIPWKFLQPGYISTRLINVQLDDSIRWLPDLFNKFSRQFMRNFMFTLFNSEWKSEALTNDRRRSSLLIQSNVGRVYVVTLKERPGSHRLQ